jgi:hypothetical protein
MMYMMNKTHTGIQDRKSLTKLNHMCLKIIQLYNFKGNIKYKQEQVS